MYTFQGALPNQSIRLTFDRHQFYTDVNAVIVYPFLKGELLFVHHQLRGWELPGGKLEEGELPIQAALRELLEEAGAEAEAIEAIGQYMITEQGKSDTVKQIYIARIARIHPLTGRFETDQYTLFPTPPSPDEILENDRYSPILKDRVYALVLEHTAGHSFSKPIL